MTVQVRRNILLGDIYTKETEGVLMYIPIENEVFHVPTNRYGEREEIQCGQNLPTLPS